MTRRPIALYIHVPFCQARCHYCAFNTYAGLKALHEPYVPALAAEIALWGEAVGRDYQVQTIFFGGGTPSLLPERDIARILETVHQAFDVSPYAEISLEANPGTVEHGSFRELRAAGVNRISMGVQSFQPRWQRFLGRIHTTAEAVAAYNEARAARFDNLNLDLIYGMPGQTAEEWEDDLRQTIALAPDHLSCYSLIVEEGTMLARGIATGRIAEPDPDEAADRYDQTVDLLGAAGYEQYEICNWAQPGRRCQHNLVYWRNESWLGLGPGAHSFLSPYRFADIKAPDEYIQRLSPLMGRAAVEKGDILLSEQSGSPPIPSPSMGEGIGEAHRRFTIDEAAIRSMPATDFIERLSPALERAETAILGLRLSDGLSRSSFSQRFGEDPAVLYAGQLAEPLEWGLAEVTPSVIRLTPYGRLLGNEVFSRLLPTVDHPAPKQGGSWPNRPALQGGDLIELADSLSPMSAL